MRSKKGSKIKWLKNVEERDEEEQEQSRMTINVSSYKGKERLSARYAISQFSFLPCFLAYKRVIKTSLNKLHFTHNPIISQ